jgi:succinylglutamate desuccinylase
VLTTLLPHASALRGRVLGVVGNRGAARAGLRYLGEDLNRRWPLAAGHAAGRSLETTPEARERHELLHVLGDAERDASSHGGPAGAAPIALDLHSTSAPTPPFAVLPDVAGAWPWIRAMGVPMLLGLDELTDGTLLGWLADRGWTALSLEGGQHGDPSTPRHHEAAIWIVLHRAGVLPPALTGVQVAAEASLLRRAASGLPPAVELIYRHAITPADRFAMRQGFASFDPVRRGDLLAEDVRGEILAQRQGRIIMPLYQGLGDDGYFLGRDVTAAELEWSARLRRHEWIEAITRVPGVTRDGPLGVRVAASVPRAVADAALRPLAWLGYRMVVRLHDGSLWIRRRGSIGGAASDA